MEARKTSTVVVICNASTASTVNDSRVVHVNSHSPGMFTGRQVLLQARRPSLRSNTSPELCALVPSSNTVEHSGMPSTCEQYLHPVFFNIRSLKSRPKHLALRRYHLPTHIRHETGQAIKFPKDSGSGIGSRAVTYHCSRSSMQEMRVGLVPR